MNQEGKRPFGKAPKEKKVKEMKITNAQKVVALGFEVLKASLTGTDVRDMKDDVVDSHIEDAMKIASRYVRHSNNYLAKAKEPENQDG